MDKEASDLLRLALAGLLTGGGAYAGLRLAHDVNNATKKPEKPKNQLDVALPESRIKAGEHNWQEYFWPAVAAGGGVAAGWTGASKAYNHIKKKEVDNDVKSKEKDYLNTLQKVHSKVASLETPHVDKFLEGFLSKIGESIQKEGFAGVDFPSEGFVDTLKHQSTNAWEGFNKSQMGSAAIAAWLLTSLGGAGATYHLANRMDKQKEEAKKEQSMPTEVNLLNNSHLR